MIILGLNIGHDSAACIVVNGKLVAACEEERYNKIKHTKDFPINAVKDCLKISNLKISNVDIISVGFRPKKYINDFFLKPALQDYYRINQIILGSKKLHLYFNLEEIIRNKLNFKKKIEFNDHHTNHLASTYFPSGYSKSLVVSFDGMGENETGYFGKANDGKLTVIHKKNCFPNSLGLIYSSVTSYLGWKHNCDEGIIMGLASYGNPNSKIKKTNKTYIKIFRDIIKYKNGLDYEINKEYITYHKERDTWVSPKFIKIFGKRRKYNSKLTQHHKNIASALQLRLEEVVISQLKYLKRRYPDYNKLCLSGGVALNCSLNGKIKSSKLFKEIFVQPASGDSGLAIGSAILTFIKYNNFKKLDFSNSTYLGSRFSDAEILKIIKKYSKNLNISKEKNVALKISEHINNGKIIGWFQGAAEFGPRALGNRSILCKPFPVSMKDYINKKVKFREEFRPFAPAVLSEFSEEYFQLDQESPYMLIACEAIQKKKNEIPAVIHVDNTCRVQTVSPKYNKKFYDLISNYYKISNIPVILNTSFNIKGQPIVNTPQDAIECFLKYKIDILVLNNFLIKKN